MSVNSVFVLFTVFKIGLIFFFPQDKAKLDGGCEASADGGQKDTDEVKSIFSANRIQIQYTHMPGSDFYFVLTGERRALQVKG